MVLRDATTSFGQDWRVVRWSDVTVVRCEIRTTENSFLHELFTNVFVDSRSLYLGTQRRPRIDTLEKYTYDEVREKFTKIEKKINTFSYIYVSSYVVFAYGIVE